MVIDEDVEVNRELVNEKLKQIVNQKNKKSLFSFGEKPELDAYNDRVEKEIEKLSGQSYEDK